MHSIEHLKSLWSYDPATGLFTWKVSVFRQPVKGRVAGSCTTRYCVLRIDGVSYQAHRVAWAFVHGEWPAQYIDHINGDCYDNRIENLREADDRLNQHNRRKPNKANRSGFLGVSKHSKNTWRIQIKSDGKNYYKFEFRSPEAAHEAYVAMKREVHADGCTL